MVVEVQYALEGLLVCQLRTCGSQSGSGLLVLLIAGKKAARVDAAKLIYSGQAFECGVECSLPEHGYCSVLLVECCAHTSGSGTLPSFTFIQPNR